MLNWGNILVCIAFGACCVGVLVFGAIIISIIRDL